VGSGFLVVNKWTNQQQQCIPYQATDFNCPPYTFREVICTLYNCTSNKVTWNFTYTSGSVTKKSSVQNFGFAAAVPLTANTWSVQENNPMPSGWVNIGFRCSDNQTNRDAVIIRSGVTVVCYFINYFGTVQQYIAEYGGNPSTGDYGNITLEDYAPNRTYAPTPVPAPTPQCPVDVSFVITSCGSIDFTDPTCRESCSLLAQSAEALFAQNAVSPAVREQCFITENIKQGLRLSAAAMTRISERVNALVSICPNGCPVDVTPVFQGCNSSDFTGTSECKVNTGCADKVVTVQNALGQTNSYVAKMCFVDYNTAHGNPLSNLAIDRITESIDASKPICNGTVLNPPPGAATDAAILPLASPLLFFVPWLVL
jgi:hypothetical protein